MLILPTTGSMASYDEFGMLIDGGEEEEEESSSFVEEQEASEKEEHLSSNEKEETVVESAGFFIVKIPSLLFIVTLIFSIHYSYCSKISISYF